jgi:hypothetical protein
MSYPSKSDLLAEELSLLVRHFGIQRVRAALAKVSRSLGDETESVVTRKNVRHSQRPKRTNGTHALESIREIHPEKYRLLSDFLIHLRDRQILRTSQDIRYFAQLVGLKEISGKSREDMLPKLMRFLMEQPIEKLQIYIESAPNISEQQRQMGFSVLTDKLVGKT